jgi:hypothetical protein
MSSVRSCRNYRLGKDLTSAVVLARLSAVSNSAAFCVKTKQPISVAAGRSMALAQLGVTMPEYTVLMSSALGSDDQMIGNLKRRLKRQSIGIYLGLTAIC